MQEPDKIWNLSFPWRERVHSAVRRNLHHESDWALTWTALMGWMVVGDVCAKPPMQWISGRWTFFHTVWILSASVLATNAAYWLQLNWPVLLCMLVNNGTLGRINTTSSSLKKSICLIEAQDWIVSSTRAWTVTLVHYIFLMVHKLGKNISELGHTRVWRGNILEWKSVILGRTWC